MMKYYFFLFAIIAMVSCQESMEERCAREARSYTKKHCPMLVTKDIILDSMSFDKASHTIGYHYSVKGLLDDAELINRNMPRDLLLKEVKNSPHLKLYKEAGYNFRYVYYSTKKKGTQLFEATFRKSDYSEPAK
jgi:hypothetical protein